MKKYKISRSITIKEIESVIKILPQKKRDLMASLVNSTKHLKNTNPSETFPKKIWEEGTLSNSFFEASITLVPKPDKDITRKLQTLKMCVRRESCENNTKRRKSEKPQGHKRQWEYLSCSWLNNHLKIHIHPEPQNMRFTGHLQR